MPRASVNGVLLYYEELGSGTPIVGVHGAGSSATFWEDAGRKLAELGRVIIYDRRGSNRSERPDPYERTSVTEHADDLRELLRVLGAEPAVAIGRSYGGTVALDLALRHPDALLGLALLEAGPSGLSPEYDAWFASILARAEDVEPSAVGEIVLREVFGAWEELPDAWRDVFTRNGPALLAELRGGETTDTARLDELSVPALVVTADDSPDPIRLGSEALARALTQARHVRVGGGHAIDPAGPEVLQFVTEILAPART
jgi:pimeloyl-ACP methyl ester carboxylesterase